MIYLKIDGKEVQAEAGMTIMEVADANGIRIPRLCYHMALNPIGSCRMCVVEVKPGPPRPQPACTTPVSDNMEVTTRSERLDHYRRELLQLLLVNHPLDCPICDKGGECELQELTRELKIAEQPYHAVKLPPEFDSQSPLIERYSDRCVNCERCVRVCKDRIGAAALYFDNRGYRTMVTAGGKVMDCEFCGTCIAVCPVGAIVDKTFRHSARSWELEKHRVICPYCGGGCHLFLNVKDGKLKRVTNSFEDPVTGGIICSRGRFSMNIVDHPQRLKQPLLRKNGTLQPVDWEEAFAFVTRRLLEIKKKWGAEAIAGVGSPRITNEANYLLQKFCRLTLETPHVDAVTSLDHQQILRTFLEVLGRPRVEWHEETGGEVKRIHEVRGFQLAIGTLRDLGEADAVLVLDVDLRDEMPPFAWAINRNLKDNRLKRLAIVGTRRSRKFPTMEWNSCRPGSTGFVIKGILKALLENGGGSRPVSGEYRGHKRIRDHLQHVDWDRLVQTTGVSVETFHSLADLLEDAEHPVLVIGDDFVRACGDDGSLRYVADALLFLGKKLKVLVSADKANTQGCSDMGVAPDWLPGYRALDDDRVTTEVWGKAPPRKAGMNLNEMIVAAFSESERPIKAMWVVGSNLLASLPDRALTEKALDGLELLVCQEAFLNETAELADCVFPALMSVETRGSVTSAEMRVQRQPGIRFTEGPRADWRIIQEISTRMGYAMEYETVDDIFAEICRIFPHYDQYPLGEIPEEGVWWNHLYRTHYGSVTWKRKLDPTLEVSIPKLNEPVRTTDAYPFLLIVRKSLFQSGTLSRYGRGAVELEPEGLVWLHPRDAEKLGVVDGDRVVLTSESGSLEAPIGIDRRLTEGVVWTTSHFADLPISRILKKSNICSVRLEKPTSERA